MTKECSIILTRL